ncbi:unnamed protein product [Lactuca saligna]|uniref:Uncharacterized protein n=1 Tax=Lactuca saligna TaxID=75948 RepID=A0AA35VPD8_LACSI|nr:unnamed protein product [Lactuca saligna]
MLLPSSSSSERECSQYEGSLRGDSPPPYPQQEVPLKESVPTPPPSPTHTTIPVTITPCPPPVTKKSIPITSQPPPITSTPPTSTTQTLPVYTDTTTTTTTSEPLVNVNASDADHLGGDGLDFDTFHYSLFSILDDSDDDAPLTQRHLKELNTKLDTLLASATASTSDAYSEATVKSMLDTFSKEHATNLEKENKAVEDSTLLNQQVTEKVVKLIFETKVFMTDLNTTAEGNIMKANEAI